jgi:NADH:ubiquinone oxidoreductase subunit F (NADH-binding)/NADH:ubiquinone oxidoreductase subunit E
MTNPMATPLKIDLHIASLAEQYANEPEAILEIFQSIQEEQGHVSRETITSVAHALGIPARSAYAVASFYSMLSLSPQSPSILRVCDGPVCWLHGAQEIRQKLNEELGENPDWTIERTSCLGLCDRAPAVLINDKQAGPVLLERIQDLADGWLGQPTDYSNPRQGENRIMLANTGVIDPDSIDSALAHNAYQGLEIALNNKPEEMINIIENSGLTGRGGAGFLTGRKMRFVAQATSIPKYVICNADESEPLIFKDRVLIDTNPHQILEGMAIAAYATGASQGYIYIRGEYQGQARKLEKAIEQAENHGYLGENILGSDFSFNIHVHRGAGAYICGEETALIESLEGKRGEPRLRPPYPPSFGYHGLPTLVNNVETYSAMPAIVRNGSDWYRSQSDWRTPGTKLYMILGHVKQPGLFEAPFGITLRRAIEEFGGGMLSGSTFNFALTGGAAGTLVPASLLDIPIDYGSSSQGVSLGAGAFLVCDQTVSPVAFLRELLFFFKMESCGKCTPCRVGTHRAHEILTALAEQNGRVGDSKELRDIAEYMFGASFCGLGQSVATPINSALNHFASDFLAGETNTPC